MGTTYWRNKLLDTAYCDTANTMYVGLSSTIPESDGSGVSEPSGCNYSRIIVDSFTNAVDGCVTNSKDIVFQKSSGVWFTPSHPAVCWVVFDGNLQDANVLFWGNLNPSVVIFSNTQVTIPAQAMRVELLNYIEVVN